MEINNMTINEIRETLHNPEYKFLNNNPRLGSNIILLGLGGSYAYGTNVPESDIDIRGIALNSKEEVLLHKDFEQIVDNNTDTTIYSFSKIVKLLADGNPNTLEIIFQDKNSYLQLNEIGKLLIENRHMFLSKKCFYTFGGYARQQLRRLDNKAMRELPQGKQEVHILNSIKNATYTFHEKYFQFDDDAIKLYIDDSHREDFESEIFMDIHLTHYPLRDYKCMWAEMHNIVKDYGKLGKRASNAILHNKVNKHAMHLIRLMFCCIDILKYGDFSTHCGKYLDLLMDIRSGKYMGENGQMVPEFFALVDKLELEMKESFECTLLPDKPNEEKINKLVCYVNEKVVRDEI
jgi:predicted nucleotidyltransferase